MRLRVRRKSQRAFALEGDASQGGARRFVTPRARSSDQRLPGNAFLRFNDRKMEA